MVTMVAFITTFLIMGMIIAGGIGINIAIYSSRIKRHGTQARRPKQPHLHEIIFAQYS